ncbi:hypothetical protein [Paracoccus rhizosphaerae]|uniref:Uncharacterized protein n=1 Tax=Paracoccus rhizosphaerae TaxID=1133347 RepID=A0ABV6CEX9_9RHOB|nr:hypothetical protein [Paracoccus rhizosphaerae]
MSIAIVTVGVALCFQTDCRPTKVGGLQASHDLVLAADRLSLRIRGLHADCLGAEVEMRRNHFVWLETRQKFDDAFTFIFEKTEHGWIWAHS